MLAAESERVGFGAELRADIFAGKKIAQIIDAVLAETARVKRAAGQPRQAALIGRLGDSAAADPRADRYSPGFEVGFLEIQSHAVLEGHQFEIEIRDVLAFRDLTGGTEVSVTPNAFLHRRQAGRRRRRAHFHKQS